MLRPDKLGFKPQTPQDSRESKLTPESLSSYFPGTRVRDTGLPNLVTEKE